MNEKSVSDKMTCEQVGSDFERCRNTPTKLVTRCFKGETPLKQRLCEDHLFFVDVHPKMTILKVQDLDGNVEWEPTIQ